MKNMTHSELCRRRLVEPKNPRKSPVAEAEEKETDKPENLDAAKTETDPEDSNAEDAVKSAEDAKNLKDSDMGGSSKEEWSDAMAHN